MLNFGTDGIRGIVGENLDKETIFLAGKALAQRTKNCKILISKDNRISSEYVAMLFSSGVMSQGGFVTDIGYLATPGVSFLTKELDFDYGVMISASHNPPEYNGIKIFDKSGRKLNQSEEKEIEDLMNEKDETTTNNYGKYKTAIHLKEKYFSYIKKIYCNLANKKILLDLSNGVTSSCAKEFFLRLGCQVKVINNNLDGKYINKNAGILDNNLLLKRKIEEKCDYAVAFDGDGDRICIIDKYDNILNGDYILYLLTYYYKNFIKINGVVGTTQTNLGIEKSLNSLGINLYRSDVGDKNLFALMQKTHSVIGSEQSGHVIIKEYLNTGDGLLCALVLLNIIEHYENNNEYKAIINQIKDVPQINLNLEYDNNDLLEKEEVKEYLRVQKLQNGKDYRVVVRKSGSERKIRIMVEGIDEVIANQKAQAIYDYLLKVDKK